MFVGGPRSDAATVVVVDAAVVGGVELVDEVEEVDVELVEDVEDVEEVDDEEVEVAPYGT